MNTFPLPTRGAPVIPDSVGRHRPAIPTTALPTLRQGQSCGNRRYRQTLCFPDGDAAIGARYGRVSHYTESHMRVEFHSALPEIASIAITRSREVEDVNRTVDDHWLVCHAHRAVNVQGPRQTKFANIFIG